MKRFFFLLLLWMSLLSGSNARAAAPDPNNRLSIGDATILEGNSRYRELLFPVSLPHAIGFDISASFVTKDITATAGSDYTPYTPQSAGQIVIKAGQTRTNILIRVTGDIREEKDETFIRGFLGRMLFGGEETQKSSRVLSGGEKVRCMLSRMMMTKGNVLLLDEPTNHLDLESITALNNGLSDFKGSLLFTTRDHALAESLADRVIELLPHNLIDRETGFDDFMHDSKVAELRATVYV